jgi:hypothetical protein
MLSTFIRYNNDRCSTDCRCWCHKERQGAYCPRRGDIEEHLELCLGWTVEEIELIPLSTPLH